MGDSVPTHPLSKKPEVVPKYLREVVNGISTFCAVVALMMPNDFLGKRSIITSAWRTAGVWQQMNQALRERVRQQAGRQLTPVLP